MLLSYSGRNTDWKFLSLQVVNSVIFKLRGAHICQILMNINLYFHAIIDEHKSFHFLWTFQLGRLWLKKYLYILTKMAGVSAALSILRATDKLKISNTVIRFPRLKVYQHFKFIIAGVKQTSTSTRIKKSHRSDTTTQEVIRISFTGSLIICDKNIFTK